MKKKLLAVSLLALVFVLDGCAVPTMNAGKSTVKTPDGGIWRSADGGKIFSQANDVLATDGKVLSLNSVDVNYLINDPQDANSLYAATIQGLFYSLDGGNSWQQYKALAKLDVQYVAVNPKNKCVVYAISGNKLYKTENCGRDFNNVYFHQKDKIVLTGIAIDFSNPQIIYLGTSEGEILKSLNGGLAWAVSGRLGKSPVMDILIDPRSSQILYAGTKKDGLYRTNDSGANWLDLGDGLKSYVGSHDYRQLIVDPNTSSSLFFVSKFGLLRSLDNGNNWNIIDLLLKNKSVNIDAVAVNPKNSKEVYYVTGSTLVKTADGGQTWLSKKLPYSRLTTFMQVIGNNIYLTTEKIQK